MTNVWTDVRYALRTLRKSPLVTALAALSLALAIAGNTVVFSFVNALLYRPLPYPEPDRIVLLGEREGEVRTLQGSALNLLDWRERSGSFLALGAYRPTHRSLGSGDQPQVVPAAEVTPEFFQALGTRAARGRLIAPEDAVPGGNARVAVVAHAFRERRMEQYADPIGHGIVLNGETHTVIGVLPEDFEFLAPSIEIWLPMVLERSELSRDRRDVMGVARLRPGVEMDRVKAEMATLADQLAAEYPEANRGFTVDALNLRHEIPDSRGRTMIALLQGAVGFVLLIACANIANLLLARSQGRRREIAIRTILGAGRRRILRQLLTESVALATMGGALGLAMGAVGIRLIAASFAAVVPSYFHPVLDGRVLAFTATMALASGILFGIAPALESFRLDLANVVKEGGRGTAGTSRRLVSRSLVVAEIAMSLMLLGGGSVLVRSFLELRHGDAGFVPEGVLTAPLTLPARIDSDAERAEMIRRIEEHVRALPGIAVASLASSLPMNVLTPSEGYALEDVPLPPGEALPRALWLTTSPDYLETLQVRLLRGRYFTSGDGPGSVPVTVVNQALAEHHWPGESPLGRRLVFRGSPREIVGVVANTRQSLIRQGQSPFQDVIYLPSAQLPGAGLTLLMRAEVDPHGLAPLVRSELVALDSQLAVGPMLTVDEFVDQFFVGVNVFNTIFGGFGALALLLATLGTYGVLAYNVGQRSHEIAVRMAVGARRGDVLRMVTRQGLVLGVVGIALGMPGVVGITRLVESLLVAAPPVEWATLVTVTGVLLVATIAASLVPASRAASLEPVRVLRDD
jgi:putative ABC transport system permease protein